MTGLEYMLDSYLFESKATIVEKGENDFGHYIILDQTIFYPQGGGQPSDSGMIKSPTTNIEVQQVRADEHGQVLHYVSKTPNLEPGEEVILIVDEEKRRFNTRNHSAGHLIDLAVKNLGYHDLIPQKGFHFPNGSYVEYSGALPEEKQIFMEKLEQECNRIIGENRAMIIEYETSIDQLPNKKTRRTARFEGDTGCGCGGTHVRSSREIGVITIRKIKNKDAIIRVSYEIK